MTLYDIEALARPWMQAAQHSGTYDFLDSRRESPANRIMIRRYLINRIRDHYLFLKATQG